MSQAENGQAPSNRGILAALASPVFLGLAPIFGKMAINGGADPFTVAALRTVIAVAILWGLYAVFARRFIYVYPAGLLGCVTVGAVNGIGSLMYYNGLARLDASLAQLLNGMYLIFMVLLVRFGGQEMSGRTKLRVVLAFASVVLLTGLGGGAIDWFGVGLMIGSALMYAGHVLLSQRVLYEMPPQTVTLYVLTTMGAVVMAARLVQGFDGLIPASPDAYLPIVILALTTAASRLTLFAGVKNLGGLQTVLLGIAEVAISLVLAYLFLGDRFTSIELVGTVFMLASMALMRPSKDMPVGLDAGTMPMPNMAGMSFKRVAYLGELAEELKKLSPEERELIRMMMDSAGGPPGDMSGGPPQASGPTGAEESSQSAE